MAGVPSAPASGFSRRGHVAFHGAPPGSLAVPPGAPGAVCTCAQALASLGAASAARKTPSCDSRTHHLWALALRGVLALLPPYPGRSSASVWLSSRSGLSRFRPAAPPSPGALSTFPRLCSGHLPPGRGRPPKRPPLPHPCCVCAVAPPPPALGTASLISVWCLTDTESWGRCPSASGFFHSESYCLQLRVWPRGPGIQPLVGLPAQPEEVRLSLSL